MSVKKFRTGKRPDGSDYKYPMSPRSSRYEFRELVPKRISFPHREHSEIEMYKKIEQDLMNIRDDIYGMMPMYGRFMTTFSSTTQEVYEELNRLASIVDNELTFYQKQMEEKGIDIDSLERIQKEI